MAFSNLEFVKNLRSSGLTIEQSEAISKGVSDLKEDMNHLTTKEDFKELKTDFKDLKNDFKDLRNDFKDLSNEVKNQRVEMDEGFKGIRRDMNTLKNDLLAHCDRFESSTKSSLISFASMMFVVCTTLGISVMVFLHR
jgi:uncharacterized coiled-coil DUF342 family protein